MFKSENGDSSVYIGDFEYNSHFFLVFLMVDFEQLNVCLVNRMAALGFIQ